jgi:AcrR family transcriptional regulator
MSQHSSVAALPARQRILVTAHDLFYRHGIRATGIDKVIAESGVTKVTFYRHFPSKAELIHVYLEYRHELWIDWFRAALVRHGAANVGTMALLPTLKEWFEDERFRGCAFINAAVELGTTDSAVLDICQRHKEEMVDVIASTLPMVAHRAEIAHSIALAVDGAVVHVQLGMQVEPVLANMGKLLAAWRT